LAAYYAENYQILAQSADEDQLLTLPEGKLTYRLQHQAETLLDSLEIPVGAKILDYGCAKAETLRRICQFRPDLLPFCFDVSDDYHGFWRTFVPDGNWSTHLFKEEWDSLFDIVTTFFALEHVESPKDFITGIHRLLKVEGKVYGIVPNLLTNTADLVVADHVNHFTRPSLERLLGDCGFSDIEIFDEKHPGALLFIGNKSTYHGKVLSREERLEETVVEIAKYWESFVGKVRKFEAEHSDEDVVAIYGSGFYGSFIYASLQEPAKVRYFIDQNPYRQKVSHLGVPVIPASKTTLDLEVLYVGLNPKIAREAIESVEELRESSIAIFVL
jgi:cyclopropane fatty-acyl-phospholipid synthase-like methyltransferase